MRHIDSLSSYTVRSRLAGSIHGTVWSTLTLLLVTRVVALAEDKNVSSSRASSSPIVASLCDTSASALRDASKIRGLVIKHPVPCIVQDKEAVRSFIDETIKTELPKEKIHMEEMAYKAIGLIPDEFDYEKQLVSFLVSQIGGYYDPRQKHFVMAAWLPESAQRGVAVHELTHALQDQYHDLQALLDQKKGVTDSDLAVSALIEGDASAVMFDRELRLSSGQLLQNQSSVDSLVLLQVMGLHLGDAGNTIPDSLKGLLIFPYTSGLRFVHTLLKKGGYDAVDRAYKRVPRSSREILHPQDYINATFVPNNPEISELPQSTSEYKAIYSDVLGEFGISSLFTEERSTKQRAASLASGWVGDRLGVFPAKEGKRLISWLTRWEHEAKANEFLRGYKECIQERYGREIGAVSIAVAPGKEMRISQQGKEVSIEVIKGE